MKLPLSAACLRAVLLLALPFVVLASHQARAAETKTQASSGQLVKLTEKDAAWAAKQRASYPLKECVISGQPLGSMGQPPEYAYRVDGQADRFVMFCCNGCKGDFLKAPEEALAKLQGSDRASPPAEAPPAEKPADKPHHH